MDESSPVDSTNPNESAHENLQVIRDLMERATVYRAISATPALVGGLLAIAISLIFWLKGDHIGKTAFVLSWLGVLIVVDALNTWLLFRESKSRQGEFPSQKMIHGIFAMGPPMIVLGCLGLIQAWVHGEFVQCVLLWIFGYGLGLLATSSFAPGSIKKLGWQFLAFGAVFVLLHEFEIKDFGENTIRNSSHFMFFSFGLLHLLYWLQTRGERTPEA